jgi:murein DD-endopeptidase
MSIAGNHRIEHALTLPLHLQFSLPDHAGAKRPEFDMRISLTASLLVLACNLPASGFAATLRDAFAWSVPVAPTPIRSGESRRLAYEIHLTNFANVPLTIDRLDAADGARPGQTLASWSGDALLSLIAQAGAMRDEKATRTIAPGRHAIIYVDVTLPLSNAPPKALVHRLVFSRPDDRIATELDGANVVLAARPAVVLGPPLRGGDWVALHDPAMTRGHRRVSFAFDGSLRIPARFAIDWMRIDAQGRLMHGDEERLDNWLGYDADVLAVADATVVALRDSIAEPSRLGDAVRHPLEDASGNYVSLDLGGGRYAHYEHLKPGSVRVRVGQRVRRGESIARLGFTGDATGPHLHLHVSDGTTPLAGEGVPFALDRFEQLGAYPSMQAFGAGGHWTDSIAAQRSRNEEMPAAEAVVKFRD